MRVKRRSCYITLLVVWLCLFSYSLLGAHPSLVKVGLISIYNNVSSITLSSDEAIAIGYYDEGGFTKIGSLPSERITISKLTGSYYDLGKTYYSYEEAASVARDLSGIPVYMEDGLFAVYSKVANGNGVSNSIQRYVVKDMNGAELLIFNKASRELVFRGYDRASGLYLTGVGTNKKYRGAIGVGGTTGITPYNILDIEEYLYGVVPGEMPASWPEEALKAQAVAARSIAIYQYNRYVSAGYNLVDTTATQVYGGYTKEDPRTNAAVDATRGQTINYNGKVAEAVYFSTSGGVTESAVNVWGGAIDYLVGVSDSYETEPEQPTWSRSITMSEIDTCLAKQGISIGKAQGIQIMSRTDSGRVQEMKILGSNGSHMITSENIRTFFSSTNEGSLKSRLFSFSEGIVEPTEYNKATSSHIVTVLSANGMTTSSLSDLVATNGRTISDLGENVLANSSTEITPFTNKDNSVGSNNLQESETVWGDFTIYGKGFGHGVGMSQSGAKGMAKAGFDYISILKHYYTGITVG